MHSTGSGPRLGSRETSASPGQAPDGKHNCNQEQNRSRGIRSSSAKRFQLIQNAAAQVLMKTQRSCLFQCRSVIHLISPDVPTRTIQSKSAGLLLVPRGRTFSSSPVWTGSPVLWSGTTDGSSPLKNAQASRSDPNFLNDAAGNLSTWILHSSLEEQAEPGKSSGF